VTSWRLPILLTASACALAAGTVTLWWVVGGAYVTVPFALAFLIAGVLLVIAAVKQSVPTLVVALALTVFAALEPLGGVTASALLRAPIPWLGSVVPLCLGVVSIAGSAVVLLGNLSSSRST
jgi:hypothetical protein